VERPQLLARVAGAISLAGLDILAVDAYGARNGIVLDTFIVTSATLRPVTTETFVNLDRLLGAALRDRLELRTRLAERRHHYPARSQAPLRVTTVSAGYDTAVRVTAPDRPGLLHDLAQAVSATELNIRWAKVKTVDTADEDAPPVLGMTATYVISLKDYDAAGEAKKVTAPILVLYAGRDFEVTAKDFDLWKAGLAGRKDATFREFPALNHLMVAGEGKSTDAEYRKAGHVAPEIVDEIAKWVAP